MEHETGPDEAKAECVAKMGDELGLLYSALWQELAWVHMKWEDYVTLFGVKESRIRLLNDAAGSFFRVIEDGLWEDVLLHIARLTDAPSTKGQPNLTIRRFTPLIKDSGLADRVKQLTDEVLDATRFCRDWRDRHIAHRNLRLVLDATAKPLAPASRQSVRLALQAMVHLLDAVSEKYLGSTNLFDWAKRPGGAFDLLWVIQQGLVAAQERRARIELGEHTSEDFRVPPEI